MEHYLRLSGPLLPVKQCMEGTFFGSTMVVGGHNSTFHFKFLSEGIPSDANPKVEPQTRNPTPPGFRV